MNYYGVIVGFLLGSSDGRNDGSSLGKTLGSSDGIKLGYNIESRRWDYVSQKHNKTKQLLNVHSYDDRIVPQRHGMHAAPSDSAQIYAPRLTQMACRWVRH